MERLQWSTPSASLVHYTGISFANRDRREDWVAEMEKELPMEQRSCKQPLEVDIRKILEQMGIHKETLLEQFISSSQRS